MFKTKSNVSRKRKKEPVLENDSVKGFIFDTEFEIVVIGKLSSSHWFSIETLEMAAAMGAITVSLVSFLERKRYTAKIADVLANGLSVGDQVYYLLKDFAVSEARRR